MVSCDESRAPFVVLLLPEKEHDKRWRSEVKRSAQALPGPDPATLHRNVAAHIVDVIDATLLPPFPFYLLLDSPSRGSAPSKAQPLANRILDRGKLL